jgi:hypothetical protein
VYRGLRSARLSLERAPQPATMAPKARPYKRGRDVTAAPAAQKPLPVHEWRQVQPNRAHLPRHRTPPPFVPARSRNRVMAGQEASDCVN